MGAEIIDSLLTRPPLFMFFCVCPEKTNNSNSKNNSNYSNSNNGKAAEEFPAAVWLQHYILIIK